MPKWMTIPLVLDAIYHQFPRGVTAHAPCEVAFWRMFLALAAEQTAGGAVFARLSRDRNRVASRWLVGRIIATALAAVTNLVSTVGSGAGVKLPTAAVTNDFTIVYNDGGANPLLVYPDASTSKINQLAVGVAITLAPNTAMFAVKVTSTRWVAFLSA